MWYVRRLYQFLFYSINVYKNQILAPFLIFLFTISVFFINPVFAEPVEVEIDWTIEGQLKTDLITPEITEEPKKINNNVDGNSLKISPEIEIAQDFVTGSGYTIGDRIITIDSEEGQILNQILIEQREINRDNFFHMIKYLDRHSDGYVELAESLLDPVKQQKYVSHGISRDVYIDSNLEHFLIERGYSLNDVESIPNEAFSPTKYDEIRKVASNIQNSGGESIDLRELLPNYVAQDSQVLHEEMIRKLSKETTNVYESISSSQLEISVSSSPDFSNPVSSNLFDDFQFVNTKFENTQHVINTLEPPKTLFDLPNSYDYNLFILISIILPLTIFGYLVYRKSIIKRPLEIVTVPTSINYVENTLEMIQSSRNLYDDNMPKYAFEKFSQAIRYYYSHKLEINLDLTHEQIMNTLKKSDIQNYADINRWLQLCGQVEFVKHKSSQKEFINALDDFTKSIS